MIQMVLCVAACYPVAVLQYTVEGGFNSDKAPKIYR